MAAPCSFATAATDQAAALLRSVSRAVEAFSQAELERVEPPDLDEALELAIPQFSRAAAEAELPAWPVAWAEVEGEDEFGGAG